MVGPRTPAAIETVAPRTAMPEPENTMRHLRRAITERMLGINVPRPASEGMAPLMPTPSPIVRVPCGIVREGPAIAPKRRTIARPHQ